MKKLFLILLIFVTICTGVLKSQVQVILTQPPPFQFNLDKLWKVTLINSGPEENVYIQGEVKKNSGFLVEARSSTFLMRTGTRKVSAGEISPVDVKKYSNEFDEALKRTGYFPNGTYDVCVYVKSAITNNILGSYCFTTETFIFSPPTLTFPNDNEILYNMPVFSWMPPLPLPSGAVSYKVIIKQILHGQSTVQTFNSVPSWFEITNLRATVLNYPLSALTLEKRQKYAWRVDTYIDGNFAVSSELRTFTLGDHFSEDTLKHFSGKSSSVNENFLSNVSFLGNLGIGSGIEDNKMFSRKKKSHLNLESAESNFSIDYKMNYSYSNSVPPFSKSDRQYLNVIFTPKITIGDIPFALDIYVDTRQKSDLQNINTFSNLLNFGKFRTFIETKLKQKKEEIEKKFKSKIEQSVGEVKDKLISNQEDELKNAKSSLPFYLKFFSHFNELSLFDNYPVFTKNTLSGVKLTGANIDFYPGIVYMAYAGFNNLQAIKDSVYRRSLNAGRFGVGNKNESHFHFGILKANDDEYSINAENVISGVTPKENVVLSSNAQINLFKDNFSLGGEVSGSMLTRDKFSPEITSDEIPSIVKNLLNPKQSSQFDYMFEINSQVKIPKTETQIETAFQYLGPGYITLGAPDLKPDKKLFKIKIEQKLFQDKVSVNLTFNKSSNNVAGFNSVTNSLSTLNISLKAAFKDYPYFVAVYSPNSIDNAGVSDSLRNKSGSDIYMLNSGYNLPGRSLSSFISGTLFIINNSSQQINSSFKNLNATLSDMVTFMNFPLSLNGVLGLSNREIAGISSSLYTAELSGAYSIGEAIELSMGINHEFEKDLNSKTILNWSTSFNHENYGKLVLDINLENYKESFYQYGNYNDVRIRFTASKTFK